MLQEKLQRHNDVLRFYEAKRKKAELNRVIDLTLGFVASIVIVVVYAAFMFYSYQ